LHDHTAEGAALFRPTGLHSLTKQASRLHYKTYRNGPVTGLPCERNASKAEAAGTMVKIERPVREKAPAAKKSAAAKKVVKKAQAKATKQAAKAEKKPAAKKAAPKKPAAKKAAPKKPAAKKAAPKKKGGK